MMTKTTSAKKAFALKAGLAPVGAALLLLLCTKAVAQQANPVAYQEKNEKELKEVYGNTQFKFIDKNGTAVEKNYANLTPAEKRDLPLNPAVKADYIEFNETGGKEKSVVDRAEAAKYSDKDKVYTMDEVSFSPEYPGGINAFYSYIVKNIHQTEMKGEVQESYSFVVEKDGTVSNVNALNNSGYGTAEQVIRLLKESGKWTPAKKENETVRSVIVFPLSFGKK